MTQAERNFRMYDRMCLLIAKHGQIGMGIDYSTALVRCYYWKLISRGLDETGLSYDTCAWINKREKARLYRIMRTDWPEYAFHRYCMKVQWERNYNWYKGM